MLRLGLVLVTKHSKLSVETSKSDVMYSEPTNKDTLFCPSGVLFTEVRLYQS